MAFLELHADYDRNRRLSANATEYSKRKRSPGALILPNIDRDDRSLPKQVAVGSAIKLDWMLPTKTAQDNEPVAVKIRAVQSLPPDCQLFLRASGALAPLVRVRDAQGRRLPIDVWGLNDTPLTLTGTVLDLMVETDAFAGTPILDESVNATEPRRIDLILMCKAPRKQPIELDRGVFNLPPLLISDDLSTPQSLYMAVRGDDANLNSVMDVERACRRIGVRMVPVPPALNHGDVWLQDQFQLAYCNTVSGKMQVIIHLPRARANFSWSAISNNLAPFIDQHFPSRDLGVVQDFWRRTFEIREVDTHLHSLSLVESQVPFLAMGQIFRVRGALLSMGRRFAGMVANNQAFIAALKKETSKQKIDVLDARAAISHLLSLVQKILKQAAQEASDPSLKAAIETRHDKLMEKVKSATKLTSTANGVLTLPIGLKNPQALAQQGTVTANDFKTARVSADEADRLLKRLEAAHDSYSYGGNLECSPPFDKFSSGRIVVGNVGGDGESVDPGLLGLLRMQDAQSLVEIDTSWLQVAHVDEAMAFVPHEKSPHGFAIVRAAPDIALDVLDQALKLYVSELSIHHPHRPPHSALPSNRRTWDGDHPLTMMLRGKLWHHVHGQETFEPKEPPRTFKELSLRHTGLGSSMQEGDRHEEGPLEANGSHPKGERHYPAAISALEFLVIDDGCNSEIEKKFLGPLEAQLKEQFSDVPVVRLPVLYDIVDFLVTEIDGVDENGKAVKVPLVERDLFRATGAFLPNGVNLQVLGKSLLVPRPFGPRMSPADAAVVVRTVLERHYPHIKPPTMNASFFAQRQLDRTTHWINAELDQRARRWGINEIVSRFRDGFDKSLEDDEVKRRIRVHNANAFIGDKLKKNWHELNIPEGTVDLFEALYHVLLAPHGVTIHWVDSWYYHDNSGEIHCGTNVLRKPR